MDITALPYIERLVDSIEHIYLLRRWLHGDDIEMWWKLTTGECCYLSCMISETAKKSNARKVIRDKVFDSKKFDLMIRHLTDNGVMELQSSGRGIGIMTNYDDFYHVSLKDGSSNFFRASFGQHHDPRYETIRSVIFDNLRELNHVYKKDKRKK